MDTADLAALRGEVYAVRALLLTIINFVAIATPNPTERLDELEQDLTEGVMVMQDSVFRTAALAAMGQAFRDARERLRLK